VQGEHGVTGSYARFSEVREYLSLLLISFADPSTPDRKITLIFSDVVVLGKNTPPVTEFLSAYPNARYLEIIWKNTWERHDPRWKSIISGNGTAENTTITHLELRIDNAISSFHLRNPWKFIFNISHLRLANIKHFTLSRQCSMEGSQDYRVAEDRITEALAELPEVYQKFPSLESVNVDLRVGLHMKHTKSFWVCGYLSDRRESSSDLRFSYLDRSVFCANSCFPD
jgi:hypothetical protein